MNNRRQNNTDGFVLRRRTQQQNAAHKLGTGPLLVPERFKDENPKIQTRRDDVPAIAPMPINQPVQTGLKRSEMDASLADIDAVPQQELGKHRHRFSRKGFKRVILVLLVLFLAVGGYLGVKFLITSGRVFNGNLFSLLGAGTELKTDSLGRTNILIFGTSEDDPSHSDAGPDLADSIMLVSVDQKTKQAALMSIPRDLYVKYGEACNSGYEGKINEVYQCGAEGADEKKGSEKLMSVVGENFGLDVQYYAHVNYTVLRETVDAVGGITVNIESDDPRGILDRNFDWTCKYNCYLVKWPNGPAQLDGTHALALARARNDSGGYGLSRSNFDREQNQQKILLALKDKAVSAGTLTNPVALSGLLDALGNNVRTNFDTGEVKTLTGLAADIKNENIKRVDLIADGEAVLTTGSSPSSGSIVRPIAGLYDFSKVKTFVRSKLTQVASGTEEATIEVLNGSDTSGVAGVKAEELTAKGIIVSSTGDAPTSASYGDLQWFDLSGNTKPKTNQKLTTVLGEASSGTTLPSDVQSDADFVIIVGNGVN
ncbi:LCP family protein [Pedobacter sp.]|nr:LCP family protein [Candidatus Saccharibacteria bacterium]